MKGTGQNSWVAWLHGYKDDTEVLKVQLHGSMKIIDKYNFFVDGFASLWKKGRGRNSWVAWLHEYKDYTEVLKVQLHGCMKMIDE